MITVSLELKREKKAGFLIVLDQATIYQANDIMAALSEALKVVDRLTVDVKGVTDTDLTFVQLICAAHRSSLNMKRSPRLDVAGRESLDAILEPAFSNIVCSLRDSHDCLLRPEKEL